MIENQLGFHLNQSWSKCWLLSQAECSSWHPSIFQLFQVFAILDQEFDKISVCLFQLCNEQGGFEGRSINWRFDGFTPHLPRFFFCTLSGFSSRTRWHEEEVIISAQTTSCLTGDCRHWSRADWHCLMLWKVSQVSGSHKVKQYGNHCCANQKVQKLK